MSSQSSTSVPRTSHFRCWTIGYVYLAATRLSLHRTEADWGMVIEVFGYSPRAGLPDTHIHTFASSLQNRDSAQNYRAASIRKLPRK